MARQASVREVKLNAMPPSMKATPPQNLTDEIYTPRSNSDVSGRIGAPRSFGIQLTRIF